MPSTFMRIGENAAVCWALCCRGFHFKSPFFPWAQWAKIIFDQVLSLSSFFTLFSTITISQMYFIAFYAEILITVCCNLN